MEELIDFSHSSTQSAAWVRCRVLPKVKWFLKELLATRAEGQGQRSEEGGWGVEIKGRGVRKREASHETCRRPVRFTAVTQFDDMMESTFHQRKRNKNWERSLGVSPPLTQRGAESAVSENQ